MANINDLILEELKEVRAELKTMGNDVAVLKSMHNNGNRSERIAAICAILAVVVSVIAFATACGVAEGRKPSENNITIRDRITGILPGKIQPKEANISN